MSALLMGLVWGIQLDHQEQAVMLALADHAQDDGAQIFPSVDRLAWKTGYTRRNVQYVLKRLEAKHLIIAVAHEHGGRGRATEYVMRLDNGTAKAPFENKQKGAKYDTSDEERAQSTTNDEKGAKYDTKRAQSETKGRKVEHKRVQPRAPQPSYNHNDNHHEETAHTREDENVMAEAEAEPDDELPTERLTFSAYQRWYHEIFGAGTKYSTVYKAWLDYCAEYDSMREAIS